MSGRPNVQLALIQAEVGQFRALSLRCFRGQAALAHHHSMPGG
jgi:hypothetical protein